MMMRALEAGGMEACYLQSRDVMKDHYRDEHYDPNIGGLYELGRRDYNDPQFPRMYAGKLIKALRTGPATMRTCKGGIKVVWMCRDAEEQRQSYMAFFGGEVPTVEQINEQIQRGLEGALNRKDTEVMLLDYRDVVEYPALCLQRVGKFYGVDLDIRAAVEVIDPEQYRFRLEELEVGIV